jgi:O-antigen/teichoic acid export membrane protein
MTDESLDAIRRGMSRGVAWMLLQKVFERTLSLVSVAILARLLVPSDFGLVALAVSTVAVLEVLGAFGLDIALIREPNADRSHFDAAWTFNVLFGCLIALMAAGLAPLAGSFYGDQRLVPVIVTLGASRAIAGFENIGVVHFRKDLQFHREFRYVLAKRAATSLLVTIPLALTLRSYWALVAGTVAGTCIAVVLSYALHPFRPRPSFARLRELMRFSKWLLAARVLEIAYGRLPDFIVGRVVGAAPLGALALARDLARLPVTEVAAPVNRAVFPGYAKLAADRGQLRLEYLRVTSRLLLLVVPAAGGLCVLAEPVVLLLLGDDWKAAIPLVRLLALNAFVGVWLSTAHTLNLAVGMARSTTWILALHAAVSVPLMLWLVPAWGAAGAALALLLASLCTAPANFILLGKAIPFRARDAMASMWRPVVATLVMGAIVSALAPRLGWPAHLAMRLACVASLVASGVLVYVVGVLLLWRVWHVADSAEAWAVARVRAAWRVIASMASPGRATRRTSSSPPR